MNNRLPDKLIYQKLREMRYSPSVMHTVKEPLNFGERHEEVCTICRKIRDELIPIRTVAYECFLRATSDLMIAEEMVSYCDIFLEQDFISITDAYRIQLMSELIRRIFHRKQLIIKNMEEIEKVYPDSSIQEDIIDSGMITITFDRMMSRYEAMEKKYPFLYDDEE